MTFLPVPPFGAVNPARIVALLRADVAAARQMTATASVIDLTGNQRRQTVAVLDSGQLVLLPMTVAEVQDACSHHL